MSIIPQPDVLPPEVLAEQSKLEKSHQAERDRLFLVYTKQWWREYLQIRASNSNRLVKLYAQVPGCMSVTELSLSYLKLYNCYNNKCSTVI